MKTLWAAIVLVGMAVSPALAQGITLPAPTAELEVGHAGFVDDATIDHAVIGGSARYYLTPRLALGPEVTYFRGPGSDRDWVVTGNLTFDIRNPIAGRPARVTPYLIAGGGWFRHEQRFGRETFASSEGAFTGGGGVRAWVSERVYVAGEYRIGWELHQRVTGHVGFALGR